MTASVARATTNLNIPHSQNTAPVHDHRCLFTYDLRRKQKRWQDGLLRFHTFNKRVMLYDDTRNFIGDTHWKEDTGLHADDEVTLDTGVLVQVGDVVATTQTDLTPLFERERKKPEDNDGVLSTATRRTLGGKVNGNGALQRKHRSLNALLGTPKGSYGRAMIPQSPYDLKNGGGENDRRDGPIVKRRKGNEDDIAAQPWSVTRVTKATPSKGSPPWARTTNMIPTIASKDPAVAQKQKKKTASEDRRRLTFEEVVDITSDNERSFTSDVTLPPSTPPANVNPVKPAAQVHSRAVVPSKRAKAKAPKPPPQPVSPPVNTKNRERNVQYRLDAEQARHDISSPIQAPKASSPKRKTLRLGKSQPRQMLFCQNPVAQKPANPPMRGIHHDPFDLSDHEEAILSKKPSSAAVKKAKEPNAPGIEEDRGTGVFPRRNNSISVEARQDRTSSPAFSTVAPQLDSHKPSLVVNSDAREPGPDQPCKSRQKKQTLPIQPNDAALGMMDQRLQSKSASTSKPKAPAQPDPSTLTTIQTADRPYRRVQSESDITVAVQIDDRVGALPAIQEDEIITATRSRPAASIKRQQAPKQPLQRTMSLNNIHTKSKATAAKSKVREESAARKKEKENGPWTAEACDLFSWRPPDWEERQKKRS